MSVEPVVSFSSRLTSQWNKWNRPIGFDEDPFNLHPTTALHRAGSFALAGAALIETAVLVPLTILAKIFSWIRHNAPYQALYQRLRSSAFTIQWNGSQITKSSSLFLNVESIARGCLKPSSMNSVDYEAMKTPASPLANFKQLFELSFWDFSVASQKDSDTLKAEWQEVLDTCSLSSKSYPWFVRLILLGAFRYSWSYLSEKGRDGRDALVAFHSSPNSFGCPSNQAASLNNLRQNPGAVAPYIESLVQAETENPLIQTLWFMLQTELAARKQEKQAADLAAPQ
jgi:hypothetical protein